MSNPILKFTLALALLAGCGAPPGGQSPQSTDSPSPQPTASSSPSEPQDQALTLFVDAQTQTCVGVGPMDCLRVRKAPEQDWTLFYGAIEGFDYEPGYAYELRVTETPVENPPADASSIKTTLVEVVKKEAMSRLKDTQWAYTGATVNGQDQPALEGAELTLNFAQDQVSGSTGCNSFSGGYTEAGNALSFEPLAATERACLDAALMAQETEYLKALGQVSAMTLEGDTLTLQAGAQTQLHFAQP